MHYAAMRVMNRILAISFVYVVLLLQILLHSDHVQAGILSKIVHFGREAGSTVKNELSGKPYLISELNSLPYETGTARLAVEVTPDGSLNLLAEDGQSWLVRSAEDYRRIKSMIIKNRVDSDGQKPGDIRLFVTQHQLFESAGNELLKQLDKLYLIEKRSSLPVRWVDNNQPHWSVSINDQLKLAITSPEALSEGLWRLNNGINLANMRLVAFSSDFQGLPSSIQTGLENRLPDMTVINPDTLKKSFRVLKHQTLVITGKPLGDELEVMSGAGSVRKINLNELKAEAVKQNINLVVLETVTPAQLGTKTLPWNKQIRTAELEQAYFAKTYGEFLSAFGNGDRPLSLYFDGVHDNFSSFRSLPDKPVQENFIGTEFVAHSLFHAIKIQARSEAYQQELDRRLISVIPSWIHVVYILNIFSGFLASKTSITIWRRFWPLNNRNDYRSWVRFILYCSGRIFLFIFGFLGLFGSLFLIYSILHRLYILFSMVFMILSWPVRILIKKQA